MLRPGTDDPKSFVAYELMAKKLSGSTFSTLASGADILRNPATTDFLYNLIYLNDTSTVQLRSTLGVTGMLLFPMKADSAFLTDFPTTLAGTPSSTAGAPAPNILTYSALPAGYYGVRFPFSASGSASYQSRTYGCPVTKAFDSASRGAFDPCAGTMVYTAPSSESGISSTVLIIVIVVCVLAFVAILVTVIVVVVRRRQDRVPVS